VVLQNSSEGSVTFVAVLLAGEEGVVRLSETGGATTPATAVLESVSLVASCGGGRTRSRLALGLHRNCENRNEEKQKEIRLHRDFEERERNQKRKREDI